MSKYRQDQDLDNPQPSTVKNQDMDGYNNPSNPAARVDHDGVIVNSPYNKPNVKYKPAEPLGIQRSGNRDPSKLDSHLASLRPTKK